MSFVLFVDVERFVEPLCRVQEETVWYFIITLGKGMSSLACPYRGKKCLAAEHFYLSAQSSSLATTPGPTLLI